MVHIYLLSITIHICFTYFYLAFKINDNNEGEKNHKKEGLNCVFGNFFFYVLDNCPQVQSLK